MDGWGKRLPGGFSTGPHGAGIRSRRPVHPHKSTGSHIPLPIPCYWASSSWFHARPARDGHRKVTAGFPDSSMGQGLSPTGQRLAQGRKPVSPSHSVGCFPDFNAWGAWGNGWQSWGNRLRIWGNAWGAWGNRVASLGQRVAPRVSRVGSRGRVVAPRGFLESGHVFGVGKHGATLGILVPGAGRSHASRGTHLPSTRTVHPTRGTRVAAAWHPCPARWRGWRRVVEAGGVEPPSLASQTEVTTCLGRLGSRLRGEGRPATRVAQLA